MDREAGAGDLIFNLSFPSVFSYLLLSIFSLSFNLSLSIALCFRRRAFLQIDAHIGQFLHHALHICVHSLLCLDLHYARSTEAQRSDRCAGSQLGRLPVHLSSHFICLWGSLCQRLLPARHHHSRPQRRCLLQDPKLPDWRCLQVQPH